MIIKEITDGKYSWIYIKHTSFYWEKTDITKTS
jgi:hypothetical protein